MFTQISVQGFKCFDHAEITLNNLTLLTGINSAGKSSMIQAVLLLMQQKNTGANPLNGEYVRLGTLQDVKNTVTNAKHVVINAKSDQRDDEYSVLRLKMDGACVSRCTDLVQDKELVYLSAERIGVEDVYQQNLAEDYKIGCFGEYAFDYLSRERMNELRESDFRFPGTGANLGNQVDYWLDYIMGYNVTAERVMGTEVVRVSYRRNLNGSKEVKPRHVGTGVSYIANVIISALSCKKGSLFIIENPEIHLHPGAQAKLLEFFCFLSARGLQIIVETHSDHIFNGLRKSLKQEKISKDQISVYFFKMDENYLSRPVWIEIDKNGIIQNYEKGLFDQIDEDLDDLLGF